MQVHNAFYSFVAPTQTGTEPYLVAHSAEAAGEVGLDPQEYARQEFAAIFSGNAQLPGTEGYTLDVPAPAYAHSRLGMASEGKLTHAHARRKSWAQCYGGHQFGSVRMTI